MEIIDVHTHLGDILNPNGGGLIGKTGVSKQILFDIVSISERLGHAKVCKTWDDWLYRSVYSLVTKASRARNATATLENMRRSMDRAAITFCACMPIPPYLTFADLKKALENEPRIIPFTGVDFSGRGDWESDLRKDVAEGARGLKLHPIIQRVPLNSPRMFEAVEAFAVHRLPVLFHCGISSYYLGPEQQTRETSAFGAIADAAALVAAFPQVTFIAGHAGLFDYREAIARLSPFKNVLVDTSFHSPGSVRELVRAFGPDRVMYGSDWPYGNHLPTLRIVRRACKGDASLARRIFYENAAMLLNGR